MSKRKEKKKMKEKEHAVENKETTENKEINEEIIQSELIENEEKDIECPDAVTDTLESLQIQNSELQDKYVRLMAEFENFKKRTRQERLDLIDTAASNMIISLLPIIDDMQRGLESTEEIEDVKIVKEGFELIYNKLHGILKQKGLEAMDCKGKEFDTDYHEALTMVENKKMKGKVVEEIEKGYTLKGKVIRFAKVIVGN
ncbi:MAG: nucleotide exchange factor GrpE [Bacteroidales bacterium]|nr:nucleotide exchange factor GrpE [Bacteroidales bacterium]